MPYPISVDFMNDFLKSLDGGSIGFFEGPTGNCLSPSEKQILDQA
jgi:hypothetical protein